MSMNSQPSSSSSPLEAGVATIDITPDRDLDLSGGAFGTGHGTLHPLQAAAFAFHCGDRRIIILNADLLGFDTEYASRVRQSVAAACDVDFEAVMLSATHTHGGPGTMFLRNWGRIDAAYREELAKRLVEVAREAVGAMQPATVKVAEAEAEPFALNRRRDGGDTLQTVTGLRIEGSGGKPIGLVISAACHPVNLHGSGQYTPDFPHFMRKQVAEATGAATPMAFLMGAAGDQNPVNFEAHKPSEAAAEETARRITEAILPALDAAATDDAATLDFTVRRVPLTLTPLPDRNALQRFIAEAEQGLKAWDEPAWDSWEYTGHRTRLEWATDAIAALDKGNVAKQREIALQALRIGDALWLGAPAELFAETGIALRSAAGDTPLLLATQTNGAVGYIAPQWAYEMDAYEAIACPRYLGLQGFAPGTAEKLTEEGSELLQLIAQGVPNHTSRAMWQRACKVIVGGGQAHKRPVKYMDRGGPAFIQRAQGPYFWDVDDRRHIDYLLGYGPIVLGHADEAINAAVEKQMRDGAIYSLDHPGSIELAELLCEAIPSAEMVMYYIGGSSATMGAIRCARAVTGREKIVRCGYHGWFDWCWPDMPGVPHHERELILSCEYDDADALERTFEAHRGEIAGVIIESFQGTGPSQGYFDRVRSICDAHGVVFVLDEVKTGMRFAIGGAQQALGIDPDLSTFGKAMCNGYPLSVVVGKRAILEQCAGTYTAATFHADALSVVAAKTVIQQMRQRDGIAHLHAMGQRLMDGINAVCDRSGVPLKLVGHPAMPCPVDATNPTPGAPPHPMMSAYFGALQRRGVFVTGHVWFLSLAHDEAVVDETIAIAEEAAAEVKGSPRVGATSL